MMAVLRLFVLLGVVDAIAVGLGIACAFVWLAILSTPL